MRKTLLIFVALILQVIAEIPTDGLIAYFPFIGNTTDYSGNGTICTVSGAVLTTDRFERKDNAYYFDGIDDNIIGHPNTNFELTDNRTLSVWVQSEDIRNQGIVGYLENEGHQGYMINVRDDGTLSNFEDNFLEGRPDSITGKWEHAYSDQPYAGDNKWHHIVGLRRNDTTYIYVDNVRQKKTTTLKPVFSNNSSLLIGQAKVDTFQQFKGKIDDIRFYNRPLTDIEISLLFNGLTTPIKEKAYVQTVYLSISHNTITYRLPKNSLTEIKCFDIHGRIIYTYKKSELSGDHSINIPNLSNGMYILELQTGNLAERKVFQIIK